MRWRVSSNGPDWTDIRGVIQELQAKYACSVLVSLVPAGGHYAVAWRVMVVASWHVWRGDQELGSCGAHDSYPSVNYGSLEGCVMALLYRLDDEMAVSRYPGTGGLNGRARGPLN